MWRDILAGDVGRQVLERKYRSLSSDRISLCVFAQTPDYDKMDCPFNLQQRQIKEVIILRGYGLPLVGSIAILFICAPKAKLPRS